MRFPFLSRTVVPCLDLSLHSVFVSTYSVFRGLWQLSLMRCEAIAVTSLPRWNCFFPIVQIVRGSRWGGGIAWENSRHLATLRLVSPPNDVWETSAEIPDLGGCFCVSSLQLLPLHLQCSRSTSFYPLLYSSVLSYASPLVVSWPFLILCLESTDFFPLVYKVP